MMNVELLLAFGFWPLATSHNIENPSFGLSCQWPVASSQ
jgi:hypothetical protein